MVTVAIIQHPRKWMIAAVRLTSAEMVLGTIDFDTSAVFVDGMRLILNDAAKVWIYVKSVAAIPCE